MINLVLRMDPAAYFEFRDKGKIAYAGAVEENRE